METVGKALKEWAAVIRALEAGDQWVVVRRGGLQDPEFALESKTFVFYPTWAHQMEEKVRPEFRGHVEEARGLTAAPGRLVVSCLGRTEQAFEVRDPAALDRLVPFTLYTPEALRERLHYRIGDPLLVLPVRAFRIEPAATLELKPEYGGCRSWVDLAPAVPAPRLDPALTEEDFERRTEAVRRAVGA